MKLFFSFLIITVSSSVFSQEEFIRIPIDKSNYDITATPINNLLIISTYKNFETKFLLVEKNKVLQEKMIKVSTPKVYGAFENGNALHVHFTGGTEDGVRDFILTFFKDNSKPASLIWNNAERDFLFCYTQDGFHKVLIDRKNESIIRETYFGNTIASTKTISNIEKDIRKLVRNKNLVYLDSANSNFEKLLSKYKAFNEKELIYIIIDKDDDSKNPDLKKITLDFENGSASFKKIRLGLPPGMEHISYAFKDMIFVFSNSPDFLRLSVFDRDSLKSKKNHLVMKFFDKMELKGTNVIYSTSAASSTRSSQTINSDMKTIDENNVKDILKQFTKGDLVLKVSRSNESLSVLFGTFQIGFEPGAVSLPGVAGSPGGVSMGRSMAHEGQADRKKAFFGFLNISDLAIAKNPGRYGFLREFKVDARAKQVLEEGEISELTTVVDDNSGYLVYILKKKKELVVEKL